METFWQDLRFGVRMLGKSPSFTAVAVLSLALGIGANTSIFSLIDAVLLKSLPVKNPEQLVIVRPVHGNQGRDFNFPIFREIAQRQDALSGIFASGSVDVLRVSMEGYGELQVAGGLRGRLVSGNYFSVLGVNALLGRVFTAEDDQVPGMGGAQGPVAVISHGFWERQFARDVSILGRTITLNGAAFTIVGVTPREFFGESVGVLPDIWLPIQMQPTLEPRSLLEVRTATWFRTMGRLKPGTDERQATTALTFLYRQLLADEILSGKGSLIHSAPKLEEVRVELEPGSKGFAALRMRFSQPLRLLMAVVGLVLLIACCNVANLLLARSASRQKEIGIRLALGSGRGRLIRQLLTESMLLAIVGGATGLLLAAWGSELLLGLASGGGSPIQLDLRPEWRVLGFTLAVSLLTGIFFGLVPALLTAVVDLNPALKESARGQTGSPPRQRFSRTLVISQVALCLVLLVGAALLIRSLQNLRAFDAGFERNNVLSITVMADPAALKPPEIAALGPQVHQRLNALPGVRSASLSGYGLLSGSATTAPVRVPGSNVNPETDGDVRQNWVSNRYFETLGMRLLLGRDFGYEDTATSPKVAVINEMMARHYFGQQSPLGKLVYFPKSDSLGRYIPFAAQLDRDQAVEIVGVVQDAKYDNLRQQTPRMTYLPWVQGQGRVSAIEVRTVGNPSAMTGQIRQALKEINSNLVIRNVRTLEDQVNRTLADERLIAKLLSFFGALALLLACVGLYGLMSYAVVRRTREIGIRMALGAQRAAMLRMILRETMLLVGIGIILGVPGALATTRLVEKYLFGLKPTDPATIVMAALLMLAVATLAGYLPARRASRTDPTVALRYE
jgi:predicted permease